MSRIMILISLILIISLNSSGITDSLSIEIPYHTSDIVIDGRLNEWEKFIEISFSDTLGKMQGYPGHRLAAFFNAEYNYNNTWLPLSRNSVEARICWDINNLYFAFLVNDQHLFAQMIPGGKYSLLHLNDGIEVYLDSKNDSDSMMDINDYQFLIDVTGNNIIFRGDLNQIESDTMVTPKEAGQNVYFEYAVKIAGTLNDSITDTSFVVEMAIPFTAIGLKPATGLKIRIDLCNNDNDYTLDGVATYEEKALRYWPFNWQGYSDFGYPDTWKIFVLAGKPGWMDTMTGSSIRRWLSVYFSLLGITVVVVILLLLRMNHYKRLPAHSELSLSKVVFLDKLSIQLPELSPNQQVLKKATDILTTHRHENYGSEKLAGDLGLSIRTLQRITKEELNITPTNFIYLVKLNLAAEFLKNHLGNVSETAYEFGFSDPGYFSKLFKKHFGLSPLEYLDKNDNPSESSVN